jgi:hypothetical protein
MMAAPLAVLLGRLLFALWRLARTINGSDLRRCGSIAARTHKEALVEITQAVSGDRLSRRCGIAVNYRLRSARLGGLVLRVLLLVLVEFFRHFIDETLVVLRMLQVAFCQNTVTGRRGIARERNVLFVNLEGRATNPHVRAVAVERLNTRINATLLATAAAATVMPTAIVMTAVTAAAHTSCVLIVSHVILFLLRFGLILRFRL